ncbi:hypothetical protein CQA53_05635 [Helicobacter didelphidarum]|uniref:Uncharacterized protein n=1 Tax=Helicobacter didelphidarum TaxID=2040648 RepID=A0A3D8ILF7_9HELI|nr:hypothetical protein [Helicobacter didelphidarum]RDU65775.1 hypothetical protein CQA53_05635 [Helicobacter didelphidarum]
MADNNFSFAIKSADENTHTNSATQYTQNAHTNTMKTHANMIHAKSNTMTLKPHNANDSNVTNNTTNEKSVEKDMARKSEMKEDSKNKSKNPPEAISKEERQRIKERGMKIKPTTLIQDAENIGKKIEILEKEKENKMKQYDNKLNILYMQYRDIQDKCAEIGLLKD